MKQGPVTAYQVSKDSGVPRARIYEILGNLVEKGIVMKEEINDTTRYSPLPVEIFYRRRNQNGSLLMKELVIH